MENLRSRDDQNSRFTENVPSESDFRKRPQRQVTYESTASLPTSNWLSFLDYPNTRRNSAKSNESVNLQMNLSVSKESNIFQSQNSNVSDVSGTKNSIPMEPTCENSETLVQDEYQTQIQINEIIDQQQCSKPCNTTSFSTDPITIPSNDYVTKNSLMNQVSGTEPLNQAEDSHDNASECNPAIVDVSDGDTSNGIRNPFSSLQNPRESRILKSGISVQTLPRIESDEGIHEKSEAELVWDDEYTSMNQIDLIELYENQPSVICSERTDFVAPEFPCDSMLIDSGMNSFCFPGDSDFESQMSFQKHLNFFRTELFSSILYSDSKSILTDIPDFCDLTKTVFVDFRSDETDDSFRTKHDLYELFNSNRNCHSKNFIFNQTCRTDKFEIEYDESSSLNDYDDDFSKSSELKPQKNRMQNLLQHPTSDFIKYESVNHLVLGSNLHLNPVLKITPIVNTKSNSMILFTFNSLQ
ncbi:hypothetical protein QAD02_003230 [Eretmocerus hayati]|uniref:Uncharacterized protein n=1 Tax=Eretmocerus hayati TaxID=131215 RepID=A0ACC2NM46_9HYME|nr:hypothetical protein QAD02_003230 [Eretmocerus hayati]